MKKKIVEFLTSEPSYDCGWTKAGWYYWKQDWEHVIGPHETEEEAMKVALDALEKGEL